jgi:hypothetical protein
MPSASIFNLVTMVTFVRSGEDFIAKLHKEFLDLD